MEKHDYKLALAPIEYEIELRKKRGYQSTPLSERELETIRHALLLADKVGNPTNTMKQAGYDAAVKHFDNGKRRKGIYDCYEAMIQQAEREIENEAAM